MEPADGQVSDGLKLLWKGERLYTLHAGTYLLLMVVAVLALVLMSLFLFFMIAPDFCQERAYARSGWEWAAWKNRVS
jgi:hypothetical protein